MYDEHGDKPEYAGLSYVTETLAEAMQLNDKEEVPGRLLQGSADAFRDSEEQVKQLFINVKHYTAFCRFVDQIAYLKTEGVVDDNDGQAYLEQLLGTFMKTEKGLIIITDAQPYALHETEQKERSPKIAPDNYAEPDPKKEAGVEMALAELGDVLDIVMEIIEHHDKANKP